MTCAWKEILFTHSIIMSAIGTLAPQAAGAGNKALAGRYLQLSIIFYTLSTLPSIAVWGFWTEEVVHWFGFDEETSAYAQLFVYPYLASYFIGGIDECLFEFLDAMGHEKYATIIEFVYAGSSTLIILLMVTLGIKDLLFIAIMQSCWSVLLSIANVAFVAYRGWLDEYWEGLVANNSLKVSTGRCS